MLAAEIERGIEKKHYTAAALHVVLDGVYFVGGVIGLRPGDDENVALVRDGSLVEERHGLRLIVVALEHGLELRQAVAVRLVELVFAASGDEADLADAFEVLKER